MQRGDQWSLMQASRGCARFFGMYSPLTRSYRRLERLQSERLFAITLTRRVMR